jgi:hypothetical protein
MFQAVGSFEDGLGQDVIVGDVAVHADGHLAVAAALSGGIGVGHYVAVHAGLGGVGHIEGGIGNAADQ